MAKRLLVRDVQIQVSKLERITNRENLKLAERIASLEASRIARFGALGVALVLGFGMGVLLVRVIG
jgi:hypothetical protein